MNAEERKQHQRVTVDGSVLTFMTVEYMLGEKEVKQLEEVLEHLRAYVAPDGLKPFEKWEIDHAFQSIMETNCKAAIQHQLKNFQYQLGLINRNQFCDDDYTLEPFTSHPLEEKD